MNIGINAKMMAKQELSQLFQSVCNITTIISNNGTVINKLKCTKIESTNCPHCQYKSKVNVWHNDITTGNPHGCRTFYLCETCIKIYKGVTVKSFCLEYDDDITNVNTSDVYANFNILSSAELRNLHIN